MRIITVRCNGVHQKSCHNFLKQCFLKFTFENIFLQEIKEKQQNFMQSYLCLFRLKLKEEKLFLLYSALPWVAHLCLNPDKLLPLIVSLGKSGMFSPSPLSMSNAMQQSHWIGDWQLEIEMGLFFYCTQLIGIRFSRIRFQQFIQPKQFCHHSYDMYLGMPLIFYKQCIFQIDIILFYAFLIPIMTSYAQ